jgi:hypothetical protein
VKADVKRSCCTCADGNKHNPWCRSTYHFTDCTIHGWQWWRPSTIENTQDFRRAVKALAKMILWVHKEFPK